MSVITEYINISTKGNRDVQDITSMVHEIVSTKSIKAGIVTAFVPGSTGAITTIEYEPGLKLDMDELLERLIPYSAKYHHHDTWHDDNGSAHLQAALIGPSITVPIVDGSLTLGTWQQIVFIDCDTRQRKRRIVVQIVY